MGTELRGLWQAVQSAKLTRGWGISGGLCSAVGVADEAAGGTTVGVGAGKARRAHAVSREMTTKTCAVRRITFVITGIIPAILPLCPANANNEPAAA